MKKFSFNQWCNTAWLKFSLLITGFMLTLIMINWNTWNVAIKCIAAVTALIPIHATEEWFFPGGFAFQYNTFLYKSKQPNRFPMNRASDMVTVLGTTIMYTIIILFHAITKIPISSGILLGATCFSMLEVCFHTYCGIRAYFKFKDKGKSTIYGAGSMTAYTGFLVLAVIMIYQIVALGISKSDIIVCILILGITSLLCFIPEMKFKNPQSPYLYYSCGYYEKFMQP